MKNIFKIFALVSVIALMTPSVLAGNDDRRGTPGAAELLINPWARSAGWGSVNTACSRGIDAFFTNVAGLSFVEKMEFAYSNTLYKGGKSGLVSGGTMNTFGLALRVGDQGVLATYVSALSFGDIDVTTEDSPEGGKGTFAPTCMNINVAYSHSFSKSIHGGVNIKVVSESTANVSGSDVAIDAGIQYVTGEEDELKFGISLKNIGPAMSFGGTGLSFTTVNNSGNNMTVEFRAAEMELPTCLNIGLSYDFLMSKWDQRLTVAANFTSNAFLKDNYTLGLEYSLLNILQLRSGFVYQKGLLESATATTANAGLCAGASVVIPLSKKDNASSVVVDYSYVSSYNLRGTHAIGASFRF